MSKKLAILFGVSGLILVMGCTSRALEEKKSLENKNSKEVINKINNNEVIKNNNVNVIKKTSEVKANISKEEAVEIVKKMYKNNPPIVEVDHVDGEYYIVHVYEIVSNEEESHTATWGWLKVNMKTGEVEDLQ